MKSKWNIIFCSMRTFSDQKLRIKTIFYYYSTILSHAIIQNKASVICHQLASASDGWHKKKRRWFCNQTLNISCDETWNIVCFIVCYEDMLIFCRSILITSPYTIFIFGSGLGSACGIRIFVNAWQYCCCLFRWTLVWFVSSISCDTCIINYDTMAKYIVHKKIGFYSKILKTCNRQSKAKWSKVYTISLVFFLISYFKTIFIILFAYSFGLCISSLYPFWGHSIKLRSNEKDMFLFTLCHCCICSMLDFKFIFLQA